MTPTCRTCRARVIFATHADGRRLPHDEDIVEHGTPDSDVLVTTRDVVRGRTAVRAWDLPDLIHHTAQTRRWTETRAAAFIADTFPAHRRHRCHQTPTPEGQTTS